VSTGKPAQPPFMTEEILSDLLDQTAEMMGSVGVDPAIIYAFRKTGLIVTKQNWRQMSQLQKIAYERAIEEFDETWRNPNSPKPL
jgi:hypothetical protein